MKDLEKLREQLKKDKEYFAIDFIQCASQASLAVLEYVDDLERGLDLVESVDKENKKFKKALKEIAASGSGDATLIAKRVLNERR